MLIKTFTNVFTGEEIPVSLPLPEEQERCFMDFMANFPSKYAPFEPFADSIYEESLLTLGGAGESRKVAAIFFTLYSQWSEEQAIPWAWYYKTNMPEVAWSHEACTQHLCPKHVARPGYDVTHRCTLLVGPGALEKAVAKPGLLQEEVCAFCKMFEEAQAEYEKKRGN